ncbi:MAG: hypothetical protein Fur0012_07360 [Elusimicrobiota bacterium]
MRKFRIAFEKEEVSDFRGTAIVIDLFRFSCTVACLVASGKKEVRVFGDRENALIFYRNNPGWEFFSEMEIENIKKFDNSPYQALNCSSPNLPAVVVTNSGSKAILSCRRAGEILIAGFHNLPYLLSYLGDRDGDFLIIPACIFYNRDHKEDFIAAEAFYKSFISGKADRELIFDIHKTGRIMELMNFRPATAEKDLRLIMNLGNIKTLPRAKIKGVYAQISDAISNNGGEEQL